MARGRGQYEGLKCKTCTRTRRFVINDCCVYCAAENQKQRARDFRRAIKAERRMHQVASKWLALPRLCKIPARVGFDSYTWVVPRAVQPCTATRPVVLRGTYFDFGSYYDHDAAQENAA